jgi:hypothetical protein
VQALSESEAERGGERMKPLLAILERQAIDIEYMIDSTLHHVVRKKCGCIKPIAWKRINRARNVIRGSRDRIRNALGSRQKTLTDPNFGRSWGRGLDTSWDCTRTDGYTEIGERGLCIVRCYA